MFRKPFSCLPVLFCLFVSLNSYSAPIVVDISGIITKRDSALGDTFNDGSSGISSGDIFEISMTYDTSATGTAGSLTNITNFENAIFNLTLTINGDLILTGSGGDIELYDDVSTLLFAPQPPTPIIDIFRARVNVSELSGPANDNLLPHTIEFSFTDYSATAFNNNQLPNVFPAINSFDETFFWLQYAPEGTPEGAISFLGATAQGQIQNVATVPAPAAISLILPGLLMIGFLRKTHLT